MSIIDPFFPELEEAKLPESLEFSTEEGLDFTPRKGNTRPLFSDIIFPVSLHFSSRQRATL